MASATSAAGNASPMQASTQVVNSTSVLRGRRPSSVAGGTQRSGNVRADQCGIADNERFALKRQRDLDYLVTEVGEDSCGGRERSAVLRMQHATEPRVEADANAQRLRVTLCHLQERLFGSGQSQQLLRIIARRRIEHCRAVAHAASNGVFSDEAPPGIRRLRTGRVAAPARFHAHESAVGGRRTDRATAIAGIRGGHDASRHRRGRASARTARRALEVPRVPRRAKEFGFRDVGNAKLWRVGLAKDHEPGCAITSREFCVCRRYEILEEPRAATHGLTGVGSDQVLDQERHATEWPVRQIPGDGSAGAALHQMYDRVDPWVYCGRTRERFIEQLRGTYLPLAHERGKPQRVKAAVLCKTHESPRSLAFIIVVSWPECDASHGHRCCHSQWQRGDFTRPITLFVERHACTAIVATIAA